LVTFYVYLINIFIVQIERRYSFFVVEIPLLPGVVSINGLFCGLCSEVPDKTWFDYVEI